MLEATSKHLSDIAIEPQYVEQAELSAFANAELGNSAKEFLIKNLGEASLVLAGEGEFPEDFRFTTDDYRYFLAHGSPAEKEQVAYRAELLGNYQLFAEPIAKIKKQLVEKPVTDIEGYLASGTGSHAFIVKNGDREYVARVRRNNDNHHIDEYLATYVGRGTAGLEQMVALSYEEGASVSERLPGVGLDMYPSEQIGRIPDDHFDQLANLLVDTAERGGLSLDGNDGNILYDPEAGFSLLDYGVGNNKNAETTPMVVTRGVFNPHYWLLEEGGIRPSEFKEDYEVINVVVKSLLPAFERWVTVLEKTVEARGHLQGYFQMDLIYNDLEAFRRAAETLDSENIVDELMMTAQSRRAKSISNFEKKIKDAPNDFMRDNYQKSLEKLQHAKRVFPMGTTKASRNNTQSIIKP